MCRWQIKMLKYFCGCFLLHCSIVFNTLAQEVPKNTRVFAAPSEFKNPSGNWAPTIVLGYEGTTFIVYSDRESNPVYSTSSEQKIINHAKFLQPFVVVEQNGDWLRLVALDKELNNSFKESGKYRTLPQGTKYFGWINKKYLLCWSHCLVDQSNHISRKALSIINDPSVLTDPDLYLDKDSGTLKMFSSPDCNPDSKNDKQIRLAQFMFIYKSSETSYLVGTAPSFYFVNATDRVFGWISKSVIRTWSDRVCYEPNWDAEAVAERKDNRVKASLFGTIEEATRYYSGDTSNSRPYGNIDPLSTQRADFYDMRFPIMYKDPTSGIVETGLVTPIIDKSGEVLVSKAEQNKITRVVSENIIREKRNINIVFVIDADPSLKEFASPIMDAIRSSIGWISNSEQSGSNVFNFGAVMYYPKGGSGEAITEKRNLTNGQEIIEFINSKLDGAAGITSSYKRSLYKGIEDAVRMFGDRRSQTNYIVLVGSAGDQKNRVMEDNLVKMLSSTITGFIGFQAVKASDPSFQDFLSEVSYLMRETSNSINAESRKYPVGTVPVPKFEPNENNTIYSLDYPTTSALDGKIFCALIGQQMHPKVLMDTLQKMIENTSDKTEETVAAINNLTVGAGDRKYRVNAELQRSMADIGKIVLDADVLAKYATESFQFFLRMYFIPKMEGFDNDIMVPVLLMTSEECFFLKAAIEKFHSDGATENDRRLAVINAYKSIYQAYVGSIEFDADAFASMKTTQVQAMISGNVSDAASRILKENTIESLKDPRIFRTEDFEELEKYFATKIKYFSQFINNPRNGFEKFETSFFWVPIDYIP